MNNRKTDIVSINKVRCEITRFKLDGVYKSRSLKPMKYNTAMCRFCGCEECTFESLPIGPKISCDNDRNIRSGRITARTPKFSTLLEAWNNRSVRANLLHGNIRLVTRSIHGPRTEIAGNNIRPKRRKINRLHISRSSRHERKRSGSVYGGISLPDRAYRRSRRFPNNNRCRIPRRSFERWIQHKVE